MVLCCRDLSQWWRIVLCWASDESLQEELKCPQALSKLTRWADVAPYWSKDYIMTLLMRFGISVLEQQLNLPPPFYFLQMTELVRCCGIWFLHVWAIGRDWHLHVLAQVSLGTSTCWFSPVTSPPQTHPHNKAKSPIIQEGKHIP